jgi:hypothetical protein
LLIGVIQSVCGSPDGQHRQIVASGVGHPMTRAQV